MTFSLKTLIGGIRRIGKSSPVVAGSSGISETPVIVDPIVSKPIKVTETKSVAQESTVSNPFTDVFDAIKNFAVKFFAEASKVKAVISVGVKDAPGTADAAEKLWTATLPVVAALSVAVKDDGINIPADTTAYQDIVA